MPVICQIVDYSLHVYLPCVFAESGKRECEIEEDASPDCITTIELQPSPLQLTNRDTGTAGAMELGKGARCAK